MQRVTRISRYVFSPFVQLYQYMYDAWNTMLHVNLSPSRWFDLLQTSVESSHADKDTRECKTEFE